MIHHIYANQSNVGDWLSARGIQSLIASQPIKEHLCDAPFVQATLSALQNAGPEDFIIIGGGGLFMDYFEPFWDGFRPMAGRVRFCIWGVGCCHRKGAPSLLPPKLMHEIVRLSCLCVVRDHMTHSQFNDCGLPAPVTCPSVNILSATDSSERCLLHVDHYDNVGSETYERMVALTQAEARKTGRSYRQTNNLIPPGNTTALKKTIDLYVSADLVVTSRLHGCVIALALGRRVLAVSGDHKVESFMQAAGLGDWVCDWREIDSLAARLATLPTQVVPTSFIERERRRNQQVAQTILSNLPRERDLHRL